MKRWPKLWQVITNLEMHNCLSMATYMNGEEVELVSYAAFKSIEL
ncbi:MAG: hypothetical protein WCJ37_01460 [Syntrophus sp. (in: bacteria)]